jgi:hypothetical protein
LTLALLISFGCTSEGSEIEAPDVLSREDFVRAYVELRVAALKSPGEELSLETRDRVLQELGLTEEDLLRFVEVNGRDVQFMRRVWEEVDSLMTEKRGLPAPSTPVGTP